MANRCRYVYKKSKATYTYNTNKAVTNLMPTDRNYDDDDGSYAYNVVNIINNFTCGAKSITSTRYSASEYLSIRGHNFIFTINSYTEVNGTPVETGYDEESGETYYEDRYEIPAGSYFTVGNYYDQYPKKAYYEYIEDYSGHGFNSYDVDTYNIKHGLLYASTDVVINGYDDSYTDDDGNDYYGSYLYIVSGAVKLVVPDVSYSTYSYSYFSSDSDTYVVAFHYPRTYTSGNTSYVNKATLLNYWQFNSDPTYAYCPLVLPVLETDLNMDPSAVVLSNTSPVAGSTVNAVVTPSSTALDYGTYTYTYQYLINNGSTWITIGTTTATSKSFTVPSSATQIKVRAQVSDGIGFTSTNYVTSPNYTVNSFKAYASISGTIKGITPYVCRGGGIYTSTPYSCENGVIK